MVPHDVARYERILSDQADEVHRHPTNLAGDDDAFGVLCDDMAWGRHEDTACASLLFSGRNCGRNAWGLSTGSATTLGGRRERILCVSTRSPDVGVPAQLPCLRAWLRLVCLRTGAVVDAFDHGSRPIGMRGAGETVLSVAVGCDLQLVFVPKCGSWAVISCSQAPCDFLPKPAQASATSAHRSP